MVKGVHTAQAGRSSWATASPAKTAETMKVYFILTAMDTSLIDSSMVGARWMSSVRCYFEVDNKCMSCPVAFIVHLSESPCVMLPPNYTSASQLEIPTCLLIFAAVRKR